jgi:LysM repeat protein
MAKSCREVLGITLAVVSSMLTACTEFWSGPAPVFVNLGAGSAGSRPVVKSTTPDTRFVTVRPGQSLGGIAEANHVSTQAVIAANRLSPPYKLKIGQHLAIPAAMAEASVKGEKTAAPVPVRSRQSTAMAHTRPPGRAKHTASAEMIPLDDPASSTRENTATRPVPSSTPDRPTWVSPPPAPASGPRMTLSPDTATDNAKPSVN